MYRRFLYYLILGVVQPRVTYCTIAPHFLDQCTLQKLPTMHPETSTYLEHQYKALRFEQSLGVQLGSPFLAMDAETTCVDSSKKSHQL